VEILSGIFLILLSLLPFGMIGEWALSASVLLYAREKQLAVIMTVPYQYLVDQWDRDSQMFGFRPVLTYQSKARLLDEVNSMVMDFSSGFRDCIYAITTHTTFISPDFQATIARLNGPSCPLPMERSIWRQRGVGSIIPSIYEWSVKN